MIHNRFDQCARRGVWQRIFAAVAACGEVPAGLSLHSTHVKVHRSAAGGKRAIGRSRGGRTSRIHCLADARGRPLALTLPPGNVADIGMAAPLLDAAAPTKRLIADKAYDADSLRRWLRQRRIKAVIPSSAARTVPYPTGLQGLEAPQRHRAPVLPPQELAPPATRYDRLAQNYLASITLVAVVTEWI